ncbi:MAG: PIN domain-containing protein [Fibrobacteres bacterium]|nr:PIN domain-containing protein [Fibrobacterota bacterium]
MLKLFIDSDIVLDMFLMREPHAGAALRLMSLLEKGIYSGYTSPLVFANVHYIMRRSLGPALSKKNLQHLHTILDVLSMDARVVDRALASSFKDFEDGLQYFSALHHKINRIITRNGRDFSNSTIVVSTPEEFLRVHDSGEL